MKLFTLTTLVIFAFFLQSGRLQAQPKPEEKIKSAGKDFWLTVFNIAARNEIYITSKHSATVTFTFTANNTMQQTYTTLPGEILKVPLSNGQLNAMLGTAMETIQNRSLHITSDSNIVVQFASWGSLEDDGTIIYPSDRQQFGNTYYLNGARYSDPGFFGNTAGGFSLVATCDNVTLEITPVRNTVLHPALVPFTIHLNKGQTYALANLGTNVVKDLSGTKIEIKSASCCNPLNVIYTGQCQYTYWPYTGAGQCCCDNLFEQVLPAAVWDTIHYIVPSLNNPYNIIKIVSAANANEISFDGITVATLNEGGVLDTIVNSPTIVTSSSGVGIMQIMLGMGNLFPNGFIPDPLPPDSMTDPNASWVLPIRDGLKEAYFKTVGQSYINNGAMVYYNGLHVLTLISKADNISTVTLNNVPLAAQFHPFPADPTFMYAEIRPDTGIDYHLISQEKIIAYYYAATNAGSINFQLGDVTPPVFYNNLPNDTVVACKNSINLLDAGAALTYHWSTDEFTQQIEAGDSGLYYVLKHYDDDCIGEMKRFIITQPPTYLTNLNLGNDTVICKGESIVLTGLGSTTEWSTGYVGKEIKVDHPGKYWATVTDTCIGFFVTDTILVMDTVCLELYCRFNLPTAFSPNNDGQNDIFIPVYYGEISHYNLSIYNRFGQRVFNSNKINYGWDGDYNGQPADLGVYFYQGNYYCPAKKGYTSVKGEVTLIR